MLTSNLWVKGAVSDIKIEALSEKRIVEMSATIKTPQDKKLKGQLTWIKRQLETCKKKNKLCSNLLIKVLQSAYNISKGVDIYG